MIEKRIRPWINKKIIEYIGEPEPTLVDFICSKVLAGSEPQSILDDVQMVNNLRKYISFELRHTLIRRFRFLLYFVKRLRVFHIKIYKQRQKKSKNPRDFQN